MRLLSFLFFHSAPIVRHSSHDFSNPGLDFLSQVLYVDSFGQILSPVCKAFCWNT